MPDVFIGTLTPNSASLFHKQGPSVNNQLFKITLYIPFISSWSLTFVLIAFVLMTKRENKTVEEEVSAIKCLRSFSSFWLIQNRENHFFQISENLLRMINGSVVLIICFWCLRCSSKCWRTSSLRCDLFNKLNFYADDDDWLVDWLNRKETKPYINFDVWINNFL